jgi:hypothetical protein
MKLRTRVFDWLSTHDKVIRPTKPNGPIVQIDAVTCGRLISGAPVCIALRHAGLPVKGNSWPAAIGAVEWWVQQDPVARASRIQLNPRLIGAVSKQQDKIAIIQLLDQLVKVWGPAPPPKDQPRTDGSDSTSTTRSDGARSNAHSRKTRANQQSKRNHPARRPQQQQQQQQQEQQEQHQQPSAAPRATRSQTRKQQQQQQQQPQQIQNQRSGPPSRQVVQNERPGPTKTVGAPVLDVTRTTPELVEKERACDVDSVGRTASMEAFLIGSLCRTMKVPVSQGAALLGRDPAIFNQLLAKGAAVAMLSQWCTFLEAHLTHVLKSTPRNKRTQAAIPAFRTLCALANCPAAAISARAMQLAFTIAEHDMWTDQGAQHPLSVVLTARPPNGEFPHPLARALVRCGGTKAELQEAATMLVSNFADESFVHALGTPQPSLFDGPAAQLAFLHDLVIPQRFVELVEHTSIPGALAQFALKSCPAFAKEQR